MKIVKEIWCLRYYFSLLLSSSFYMLFCVRFISRVFPLFFFIFFFLFFINSYIFYSVRNYDERHRIKYEYKIGSRESKCCCWMEAKKKMKQHYIFLFLSFFFFVLNMKCLNCIRQFSHRDQQLDAYVFHSIRIYNHWPIIFFTYRQTNDKKLWPCPTSNS